MDYRERGSHARGVYPTQHTSRMGRARVKQEEKNRHKNNARVVGNLEERNVGTNGKSHKQDLTSAKDLTIELPEACNMNNIQILLYVSIRVVRTLEKGTWT